MTKATDGTALTGCNSPFTKKNVRISPSSFNTFTRCERQWWFQKILGLETPSTPNQRLGQAIHYWLENYIRGDVELAELTNMTEEGFEYHAGKFNDEDRRGDDPMKAGMMRKALRIATDGINEGGVCPDPVGDRDAMVELMVAGKCGPLPYIGFVDYAEIKPVIVDNGRDATYVEDNHIITDHKSSGDYYWAKTEEQLKRDPQMLFYAGALWLEKNGDGDYTAPEGTLTVAHAYYHTRTPNKKRGERPAMLRQTPVPWSNVIDVMKRFERGAANMVKRAALEDPDLVMGNSSACGAYGGCPYAARCSESPDNLRKKRQMARIKKRGNMTTASASKGGSSIRDKILAKKRARDEAAAKNGDASGKSTTASSKASITPPDETATATVNEAQVVEVAGLMTEVLKNIPEDDIDLRDRYLDGLLRRKSLPSDDAMKARVLELCGVKPADYIPPHPDVTDSGDGASTDDATSTDDTSSSSSSTPTTDTASTDDDSSELGIARKVHAEAIAAGVKTFSPGVYAKALRRHKPAGVKRVGVKLRKSITAAGVDAGFWTVDGTSIRVVIDGAPELPPNEEPTDTVEEPAAGAPDEPTSSMKVAARNLGIDDPVVEVVKAAATAVQTEPSDPAAQFAKMMTTLGALTAVMKALNVQYTDAAGAVRIVADIVAEINLDDRADEAELAEQVFQQLGVIHVNADGELRTSIDIVEEIANLKGSEGQHAEQALRPVYINCTPEGGAPPGTITLSRLLQPYIATVERELGHSYLTDEFDRGQRKVAAKFAAAVHSGKISFGALLADSRHPCFAFVIGYIRLLPNVTIVRGVR